VCVCVCVGKHFSLIVSSFANPSDSISCFTSAKKCSNPAIIVVCVAHKDTIALCTHGFCAKPLHQHFDLGNESHLWSDTIRAIVSSPRVSSSFLHSSVCHPPRVYPSCTVVVHILMKPKNGKSEFYALYCTVCIRTCSSHFSYVPCVLMFYLLCTSPTTTKFTF
jgi:hypothetical protein